MRTTAAVVDEQGGPFRVQEVELDDPREDEVLVRVEAVGLCHTDLQLREALPAEMFPRVFGHEGAGVVEQVGAAVEGVEVGDHVLMSFRSCRRCSACAEGAVGYCENTLVLNYLGCRADGSTTHRRDDGSPVFGSFFGQSSLARHALAYADNCVVVDRSLDLARLAPYGCGFQTGAGTVLNLLRPGPDDSLVVFGCGAVGLAAIIAARTTGTGTVVAVDLAELRLQEAEQHGALPVHPASLGEVSVVDRVRELTGGGATYAIDTTAVSDVVRQAQQSLRVRGTLVALGLGAEEYTLDAIDLLQSGKLVRSSVEGESDPQEMLPRLIAMNRAGDFPVDGLVATYPFADVERAVDDVLAGRVVKPVLVW